VTPESTSCEALRQFGLYPAEVWAARAKPTVADMVRALLTRPAGGAHGVPLALIEDKGVPAFVDAVATALGCSAESIRHIVADAIPEPEDVELTGSEAVALALWRAGVRVSFAYAGTSELAMCDAFARLGLLVNGRGDRESLFAAGGASRLNPGNGAAVLHGARGLTNAMGALADLRRNEMGTVVVVGLPSTGSQPFLPPHGETGLVPGAGAFAKSWFEAEAVPAEPGARRAYVESFVDGLRRAITDSMSAPYGPAMFAVPQDVAEKPWLPLPALSGVRDVEPEARLDEAAVRQAAELVTAARRPLVLIDDYALVYDDVRPALAAFCDAIGAPVLQVKYRRGPMLFERLTDSDVPAFAGWYDPADAAHQAMMAETDLVITIEDRNMYPRVLGELPQCRKIALTSKPSAVRKNGYLAGEDVLVHSDIVASLDALTSAVGQGEKQPWRTGTPTGQPSAEPVPETAAAIRSGIAKAISDTMGRHDRPVLLDDSQMFGGMLAEEYDLLPPGMRVFGGHGGFVGSGIPIATGLAIGEPSARVLCCLGDQGFTNSMQGLVAAVQESAPVIFLVCNNGGAVSLRKQSRPSGWLDAGDGSYLDNAAGESYTALAGALGVPSRRVDFGHWLDRDRIAPGLETFGEALREAGGQAGPVLIEVVLPADPEFWAGVWITQGFEQAKKPEPEAAHA